MRHIKRIISVFLILLMNLNLLSAAVYADTPEIDRNDNPEYIDVVGVPISNNVTVNNIMAQYKWHIPKTGHGFAAERGNNLIDKIKGKNTIVAGDNCAENGPDRIIKGKILGRGSSETIYIQDKYYKTATESVNAAFDTITDNYRYYDPDGNPMRLEVPKDQYDEAVEAFRKKIQEGKVPGVTDPDEAEKIVQKGNLTYKQAKNLAKAGTIESLTYDAVHGVISGSVAFGISTLLNFGVSCVNGQSPKEAIKDASLEGLKTGGLAFTSSVIASQLSKTALIDVGKNASEELMKKAGQKFAESLVKSTGQELQKDVITQAARMLRGDIIVATVTFVVFSVPDCVNVFRGRISKEQFVKNVTVMAVSIAAGVVGGIAGGAIGGGLPGSVVGSLAGGFIGGFVADQIADLISDDDADEMYEIVVNVFAQNCEDYLISQEEADNISIRLSEMMDDDFFKDMYQSEDREAFISEILKPLFDEEVLKREVVKAPTEEELREELLSEMEGMIFIH